MGVLAAAETSTSLVSEAMQAAFSTALGSIQTDVASMVTTALPPALGIMGLFIAIRLGLKFFRSIAN